jgi:lipopolysaccharide export system protein LptC
MDAPEADKRFGAANWAVKEVDLIFSRLGRYTRFVVLSKWFLIAFVLCLVVALIAVPLVSKDRSGIRVSFIDNEVTGKGPTSSPVMNRPEYRATSAKGDQFRIGGARAVQVTPTLITIEQVEAQMLTQKGSWRSLTADTAEYDQNGKTIVLKGNVTLLDDQGYSFTTDSATIDTATSEVAGNSPIQGVGPLGNLLASSFKIMDSGKHITFMGGTSPVHLTIERKAKK